LQLSTPRVKDGGGRTSEKAKEAVEFAVPITERSSERRLNVLPASLFKLQPVLIFIAASQIFIRGGLRQA
jgi:hypothetical protein